MNLMKMPAGTGCFRIGSIIHELLHGLGFFHMHSSPMRDNYVHINWNEIRDAGITNFLPLKKTKSTSFGLPYDFESVLHYANTSFHKGDVITMKPLVCII